MTDPTNDIDELLFLLRDHPCYSRHHAALTALVAERNSLKQRVAELEAHKSVSVRLLMEERDALRKRVSYLEALSKPLYIPHGQRVESIDLRERLVCAIWPELLRIYAKADTHGANWDLVRINARAQALQEADAMLTAMRKGVTDGK